jgi:hypothetical protein
MRPPFRSTLLVVFFSPGFGSSHEFVKTSAVRTDFADEPEPIDLKLCTNPYDSLSPHFCDTRSVLGGVLVRIFDRIGGDPAPENAGRRGIRDLPAAR